MLSAATSASSIVGLSRRTRRRPHFVFQVAPIGPSSLFLITLLYQKCCTATNKFGAGRSHPMWLRTDYDVRFRLLVLTRVNQQVSSQARAATSPDWTALSTQSAGNPST